MVFGYAYPAYECYKTVELNKPDIEQLRFWCQYWILVALLTVGERIGDTFVSWVPMYSEAKLAFYIYLWYPKTKGTTYVYDSFFKPYVAKHETDIDRNLLELRTRAGDYAVSYWLKAASYGQTRVYDILQYIASQSTPKSSTTQAKQGARGRPPTATPNRKQSGKTAKSETEEPISPTSSSTSSDQQDQEDDIDDAVEDSSSKKSNSQIQPPPAKKIDSQTQPPATASAPAPAAATLNPQKLVATKSVSETIKPLKSTIETKVVVRASSLPSSSSSSPSSNGNNADAPPPVQDTVMEEAIRVTRGRLRKTRTASVR